ncbi:MAG TPA: NfeD family protein [Vicinamibacterales bacterium]|nr:NfeD family protein [Vicinamibacterales bacterium]
MRASRQFIAAVIALFVLFLVNARAQVQPASHIYTAEVDGIIHPVAAQYIREVITKADADGAALVVISLRTPGGLVDSTRDINNAIIHAKTPVAVFVGPSGNRAASAGFLITIAADIAAMAPATHIGAAHPVTGNGEKVDDTMAKKMASDVAAYARTLATQRKRNVALVEQAVLESRSFTEQEALSASPPLIDLVVNDVAELVRKLDGRSITRFDGHTQTLHTAGTSSVNVEMSWQQRVLSLIAHPQIAYLLLTLGTLGLTIELWSPGAVLPGVVGGICLLLAFFAFQVLPVSYAGVLLILFGLGLLVLEVKVTSYGLLGVGGVLSLLLGSMMLIDSPLPELQIGLRLIIPVTLGIAGILLFLVTLAVNAQRARPVTGVSAMLHEMGYALTAIEPGGIGHVRTHGEIWTASANERIEAGTPVRVTAVEGLRLQVAADSSAVVDLPPNGGSHG